MGKAGRRWALVCLLTLVVPAVTRAEERPQVNMRDRAKQAAAAVPTDLIRGPLGKRVKQILEKPAVFCRTPIEFFPAEPKLYEWLLEHPLWVTELWQQLGLEVAPVEQLENGYRISDPERGSIEFHVVATQPEMRLIYCIAQTNRGLIPGKLRAEMVIVQRYRFLRRPDGDYLLAQRLEGFVTADTTTLKAVMKLAPSSSERVAQQCLEEMMIYFSMMCRIIQVQPDWALTAVAKLQPTYAESDRQSFCELVSQLAASDPQELLPAAFQELLPGLQSK